MKVEFEPEELVRLMVDIQSLQNCAGMSLNNLTAFVQACAMDRLPNGGSSKIAAIKLLRDSFGLRLREAKLWVELTVPRWRVANSDDVVVPVSVDEQETEG